MGDERHLLRPERAGEELGHTGAAFHTPLAPDLHGIRHEFAFEFPVSFLEPGLQVVDLAVVYRGQQLHDPGDRAAHGVPVQGGNFVPDDGELICRQVVRQHGPDFFQGGNIDG
jgi:hypothetical protein